MNSNEDNTKSVTIRGVDSKVYDEFTARIKIDGTNIGDAVSQMMKDVISDFDDVFPGLDPHRRKRPTKKMSIEHHDQLTIGAEDFNGMEGTKVRFSHIKYLEFLPSMTKELVNKFIREISHCSHVKIPLSMPKLHILSKISWTQVIEIYNPETGETIETIERAEDERRSAHNRSREEYRQRRNEWKFKNKELKRMYKEKLREHKERVREAMELGHAPPAPPAPPAPYAPPAPPAPIAPVPPVPPIFELDEEMDDLMEDEEFEVEEALDDYESEVEEEFDEDE